MEIANLHNTFMLLTCTALEILGLLTVNAWDELDIPGERCDWIFHACLGGVCEALG